MPISSGCYTNWRGGGGSNTLIIKQRESKRSTKMLTTFAIKKWLVLYMVVAPIF